jgi:hypothetical protein
MDAMAAMFDQCYGWNRECDAMWCEGQLLIVPVQAGNFSVARADCSL